MYLVCNSGVLPVVSKSGTIGVFLFNFGYPEISFTQKRTKFVLEYKHITNKYILIQQLMVISTNIFTPSRPNVHRFQNLHLFHPPKALADHPLETAALERIQRLSILECVVLLTRTATGYKSLSKLEHVYYKTHESTRAFHSTIAFQINIDANKSIFLDLDLRKPLKIR